MTAIEDDTVVFPTPPLPPTNTVRFFPDAAEVFSSSMSLLREKRDVEEEDDVVAVFVVRVVISAWAFGIEVKKVEVVGWRDLFSWKAFTFTWLGEERARRSNICEKGTTLERSILLSACLFVCLLVCLLVLLVVWLFL